MSSGLHHGLESQSPVEHFCCNVHADPQCSGSPVFTISEVPPGGGGGGY